MKTNMKKGAILKSLAVSFFALASIYIYFVGMVIYQNTVRQSLNQTLGKASILAAETESALSQEGVEKNWEWFLAAGYEKPKNLEVVSKTSNVAANY